MFTNKLPEEQALHIIPCNEIHTFNMRYSIDVLYLDVNNNIIAINEDMEPSKIGKRINNARSVVELPSGKIKKLNLKTGQIVVFK